MILRAFTSTMMARLRLEVIACVQYLPLLELSELISAVSRGGTGLPGTVFSPGVAAPQGHRYLQKALPIREERTYLKEELQKAGHSGDRFTRKLSVLPPAWDPKT